MLTSSELVLWLVRNRQFPQAVHLCQQRYQRERAVIEVANLHACELWRQGLEKQASSRSSTRPPVPATVCRVCRVTEGWASAEPSSWAFNHLTLALVGVCAALLLALVGMVYFAFVMRVARSEHHDYHRVN